MTTMFESATTGEVSPGVGENVRTGLDPQILCRAVCDHLYFFQGRHPKTASRNDHYLAVAYAVRDRLFQRGVQSLDVLLQHPEARVVAYLSAEFLMVRNWLPISSIWASTMPCRKHWRAWMSVSRT